MNQISWLNLSGSIGLQKDDGLVGGRSVEQAVLSRPCRAGRVFMQPVSEAGDATAASSSEQKPLCCRRVWELERSSVSQAAWKAVQWDWSVCEKEGIVCTVCVTVWSCAFLSGEEEGGSFCAGGGVSFELLVFCVCLWLCENACSPAMSHNFFESF